MHRLWACARFSPYEHSEFLNILSHLGQTILATCDACMRNGVFVGPITGKTWKNLRKNDPETMCNLYYADLWIMPTIGPELSVAAVIAASESA
jgi:hypothetical protein